MEEKDRINQFINNLYSIYLKNNFSFFLDKCLNYNINIGNYKKNLIQLSKKIFLEIIALVPENKAKIEYKELKNSYKISVKEIDSNEKTNNVILDIPVFEENYEKIAIILSKYLVSENISYSIYLYKQLKNSILKITLSNYYDANRVIDFFNTDQNLKNEIKSRCVQFLYQKNLIGIYREFYPNNFKNFYIKNLYNFYSKISSIDEANLEKYYSYINHQYNIEININTKRMYKMLVEYLMIIINNDNIEKLFIDNMSMSLGSYDQNDYNLKVGNDKKIYYIGKNDDLKIEYGTEDYLNITYSKYYENVIKKDKNDKYYTLFYDLYDKLLSNNYKNIESLLSIINNNMDIINKQLILISSAYFAYKKLNFSLESVYLILNQLFSVLLYNNDIGQKIDNNIDNPNYILEENYGKKVVNLKNGTMTTIKEYIEKNNITNNIPNNSIIHLYNGDTITGKEFIDNLYKYIEKYDNYNDLANSMITVIEYK